MLQWKIVQQILLRFLKRGALKENFSSNKTESIRFIHHITAKPSLAFTTQTLEANVFQGESLRRVLIHIVRACCFLSANVILGFDYVDNFLLPFRASASRGSGVRMCN
ncbi:hypothetical protein AAZV13_14G102050 [Glycine max]